jgi:hypothetical protein
MIFWVTMDKNLIFEGFNFPPTSSPGLWFTGIASSDGK